VTRTKAAYYNEHDPFAAAWLRELIKAGLIADGEVDERDIRDVQPDDVRGFTQCHFFAGIGGWSYALRLAGWPDDRPIWTGSCPCQPFSAAGREVGFSDERHLWPSWFNLIFQCRPSVVVGEQVASRLGIEWLDVVASELEVATYQFGSVVVPATSVGAPHERNRLFFIADAGIPDATRRDADRRREQIAQPMGQEWAFSEWQGGNRLSLGVDDGLSARVAKRAAAGFGNAIVPQVAAEVIGAYMELCQ
jgi:DNA (cytosine-5)-methyltransferase 1